MSDKLKATQGKFDAFREELKSNPSSADDAILQDACQEVDEILSREVTQEAVHLADSVYRYMGQEGLEKRISLHRRYLNIDPDPQDRFWSHWQLVDTLAVLRRNREAIEEQIRLYNWTCQHLSDEYVLRAIEDTTQARCWKMEGRIDEWFELYFKNAERLRNPEVSQYMRCLYVRAGAQILLSKNRIEDALVELEKLERYIDGNSDWERYRMFWLTLITTRLQIHSKREDRKSFEQVSADAWTFVDEELKKLNSGNPVDLDSLAWVAHDVGACMMWANQYEEAKRFLQIAIDSKPEAWTHFFMATSIWASERDKEKTLSHLAIAQNFVRNPLNRGRFYQAFLETPEFSNVSDDEDFLEIFE